MMDIFTSFVLGACAGIVGWMALTLKGVCQKSYELGYYRQKYKNLVSDEEFEKTKPGDFWK